MIDSLVFFVLVAAYILVGFAVLSEQLGSAQSNKKLVPVRIRSRHSKE